MHTRSLVFRALIIALFLAVLFGVGLAARLVAQVEAAPVTHISQLPVFLAPLVLVPLVVQTF